MDEVIPKLWIGNLPSALNVPVLKANGIYSILSAMRGRITINETFIQHQILLDDTDDADILVHLLPSIAFIQAELDKGRGVLVHCQAGSSRSATIVAAYLMYTRDLGPAAALDLIRSARPCIQPNEGFMAQLAIFQKTAFKISRRDKLTRMFYMERAVDEVVNGDGSFPQTTMFAKYPRSPSDSAPATPGGPHRRIRCKMCRHDLATREHMLDHGQLGPATPARLTPQTSRRPSMNVHTSNSTFTISHADNTNTTTKDAKNTLTSPTSRRPSMIAELRPRRSPTRRLSGGMSDNLAMSAVDGEGGKGKRSGSNSGGAGSGGVMKRLSLRGVGWGLGEFLPMSALDTEDDDDGDEGEEQEASDADTTSAEAAEILGRRMSDAVIASPLDAPVDANGTTNGCPPQSQGRGLGQPAYASPADLAAQLYTNPKLAGLRGGGGSVLGAWPMMGLVTGPILANPKCSGYFLEPMKWMEPFLQNGEMAGRIVCPNKRCGAKLGSYDWAGVCCGCREWVVPGFCISRSKVDEIAV